MFNIRKDGSGDIIADFEDGEIFTRRLIDDEIKKLNKKDIQEYDGFIKNREKEVKTKKDNKEAIEYLESTDWYIIRNHETGKEIPQEILTKRAEAREKIK